ncbi:unnamed protein product [Ilex paraguariensis]|uniref:Uncharacterized protein n=1 Tax=Ilex paraguariensis TaxID=185542 RepID=A0ABC8RIB1_9AQUA
MENSKFETLKPSQTPFFPFPPHSRTLLRSETYRTLGRILSHCHDESQRSRALQTVPHEPKQDYGGNQRNELVCTKHTGRNMLFQKESEENKEAHMSYLGGRNQSINGIVGLLISDQEVHFDVPEFHMEESGLREKLEVDEELCIREAIDSCFGIDMTTETTKPMENNEEKKSIVEKHLSEQIEQELRQTEMKLEKLISSSGSMNSSLCVTADEDIEEGEILGGIGIYDESMDLLHEDAVSFKDKRAEEVQVAKAIMDGSSHDEQDRGLERDAESTFVLGNTGNNATNIRELELRDSIRKEVEDESVIFREKIKEAKHANWYESMLEIGKLRRQSGGVKESDSPAACLTNLVLHCKTSEESDTEIQNTSSAEKDEGVHDRKRKRVLTKERRAKKGVCMSFF